MTNTINAAQDNTVAMFDLQLFAEEDPVSATSEPEPSPSTDPAPTTEPNTDTNLDEPKLDNPNQEPAPDLLADYKPTFPEGFEADEKIMGEFIPLAKELGINPENADKFVGIGCNLAKSVAENVQQKVIEDFNNQCETSFNQAIESMKQEMGKASDGVSNFEKGIGQANALLERYGGPDAPEAFHAALTAAAGYAPDAVKTIYAAVIKMAGDATDPEFHLGSGTSSGPKSLGEVLYGKNK